MTNFVKILTGIKKCYILTLNVWFVYINNSNLKTKGDISRFNNSLKSFTIIDSIKSFTLVQQKHNVT